MFRLTLLFAILCTATASAQKPKGILDSKVDHDKTGRVFDIISDLAIACDDLRGARYAMVARGEKTVFGRNDRVSTNGVIFISANEPDRKARLDASAEMHSRETRDFEAWEQKVVERGKVEFRKLFGGRIQTDDKDKQRPGEEPIVFKPEVRPLHPIQQSVARANCLHSKGTDENILSSTFLNYAELKEADYDEDRNIVSLWSYEGGLQGRGDVRIVVDLEVVFGKDFGYMPTNVRYYSKARKGKFEEKRGLRSHTQTTWTKDGDLWFPDEMEAVSLSLSGTETHYRLKFHLKRDKALPKTKLVDSSLVDWREPLRSLFDESWELPIEHQSILKLLDRTPTER